MGTGALRADRGRPATRCSRCLLPQSLPGSDFSAEGECSWCRRGYPGYAPEGERKLREALQRWRKPEAPADCLVGISGGKDSSYVALQLKEKYGARIEAFTYVHQAMSGFALENARRICEALGVKQHLVSLKGNRHVDVFQAFFRSWLDSGDPVAAGSACIGCKTMHLLGTRVASRRRIPMVVWSDCPLENPPFAQQEEMERRSATGLRVRDVARRVGGLLWADKGYRRAFLRYASTCIAGGLSLRPEGLYLRLRYPRVHHLHFYDYVRWDREVILEALRAHAWAVPEALPDDWHSDCQLSILREYMNQQMRGATEVDAHLSNQIREGLMTREEACDALLKVRAHQRQDLPAALRRLGLEEVESRLNPACFEVAAEELSGDGERTRGRVGAKG